MVRVGVRHVTLALALAHLGACVAGCAEGGGVAQLDGSILRGLPDAGPRPLPPTDAGLRSGDAGAGPPPPFMCTSAGPYVPIDAVSCAPATVECLTGCTAAECQQACFDADPECYACVYTNVYACAQSMGCQSEWDAYICCAELNACLDAEADPMCVSLSCAEQERIVGECFDATYEACAPAYGACFPT